MMEEEDPYNTRKKKQMSKEFLRDGRIHKVPIVVTSRQELLTDENPDDAQRRENTRDSDGSAEIRQKSVGLYSFQNGHTFLMYDVDDRDGFVTHNTLKVLPESERFELVRSGTVNSHMVFHAGSRCDCCYDTPYGQLDMSLDVEEVELEQQKYSSEDKNGEGEGEWTVAAASYILRMAGAPAVKCVVKIQINTGA